MFHVPEKYRLKTGRMGSDKSYGNNGLFIVASLKISIPLTVVISDGEGWEHASVSTHKRTPTWKEICFVKDLFWDDNDVVMQLHPAKRDYINNHPFYLHLWRPGKQEIPMPSSLMVGFKGVDSENAP